MAKGAYIGVGGKARKIKKGYIGVYQNAVTNTHGLPSGYTELSYIQSSGTQCINTNWLPTSNDASFEIVFEFTGFSGNDIDWILGNYNGSSGQAVMLGTQNGTSTSLSLWSRSNGYQTFGAAAKVNTKYTITHKFSTGATTLNGTAHSLSAVNYGTTKLALFAGCVGDYFAKAKIYSCKFWQGSTLVRNYIPAKRNSDSVLGLYDLVNSKFYTNAGTGTFTAGATVTDIPAGNYARRIKKAYIGVGGVARPCWGGGKLNYYGQITALSSARCYLKAAASKTYALFAGGATTSNLTQSSVQTVDAYNASLTRSSATNLTNKLTYHGGTSVGEYVLFGGGRLATTDYATVDAYNATLSKSNPTVLSQARFRLGAGKTASYAIFAGGSSSISGGVYNKVDAYNSSLTRSTPTALSVARAGVGSATVGSYAIFAGGYKDANGTGCATVNAYNDSLVRQNATDVIGAISDLAGATAGGYAIFANGTIASAYDGNLTRTTVAALTDSRFNASATSVGDYALFGGGDKLSTSSSVYSTVNVYDDKLTMTTTTSLSSTKTQLAATTIGDYALFGGGCTTSARYSTVNAFVVI